MSSPAEPWRWVIEYLATLPDLSTSVLSVLVDTFPEIIDGSSGAVRERIALRYLEECAGMACGETPPAVAVNDPSTSHSSAIIDPALTCEEVLRSKVEKAKKDGKGKAGFDGVDLHRFILLKRATLPKPSIDRLQEKILRSHHSDVSYSKECGTLPKPLKFDCLNCAIDNVDGDQHRIRSSTKPIKSANQSLNKLSIIEQYRKMKNLANSPSKNIGNASQNVSCSLQHLIKKVPVDEEKDRQTNGRDACNASSFVTGNASEVIRDIDMAKQPQKSNSLDCDIAPNCSADISKEVFQFKEQSLNQNVRHDDRDDLQEVAVRNSNSILQPSSSQSLCVKCGRSGHLLNCHGDGCSRSIHESCLGLMAGIEKNGFFFCPFCAYRNACELYEKSKRKKKEARRNLFSFYDVGSAAHVLKRKKSSAKITIGSDTASINHNTNEHRDLPSNHQFQISSDKQKRDETQIAETNNCNGHINTEITQNQLNGEGYLVHKTVLPCMEATERGENHQTFQDKAVNFHIGSNKEVDSQLPVNDNNIGDLDRNGDISNVNSRHEVCLLFGSIKNVDNGDGNQEEPSVLISKRSPLEVEDDCGHNAKRKALASMIGERFSKQTRRESIVKTDNNHQGVVENWKIDSSSSRSLRKRAHPHDQASTKVPACRRTKLIWKPEEEDILEEAMQKIPVNEDGCISWIKILEICRPVLHESRTPIDLKDKWRNMQKKRS